MNVFCDQGELDVHDDIIYRKFLGFCVKEFYHQFFTIKKKITN